MHYCQLTFLASIYDFSIDHTFPLLLLLLLLIIIIIIFFLTLLSSTSAPPGVP